MAELETEIAELGAQLALSQSRARSAYAATEAAEAALRMAKERGIVPSSHTDEEFTQLHALLDDMTRRAERAELALNKTAADAAAYEAGVDPDAVADPLAENDAAAEEGSTTDQSPVEASESPATSDSWVAGPQPSRGLSLRKLAGATGKRSRGNDEPRR
jgi:hypothetical protein